MICKRRHRDTVAQRKTGSLCAAVAKIFFVKRKCLTFSLDLGILSLLSRIT